MPTVKTEFLGGLDQIFGKVKSSKFDVPEGTTVTDLLQIIVDKHLEHEKDKCMFLDDDGVSMKPGILVLINDVDWELEGEGEYVLQSGDLVSFTSTLHGG